MIASVEKALLILERIAEHGESGLAVGSIAEQTGLNKSTCCHLLKTLAKKNYVERVPDSRLWRIGYAAYHLTRFGKYSNGLYGAAHPVLQWLHKMTGQTPVLCVMRAGKRICIDHISGEMNLDTNGVSLIVEELHNASTGLVLLAHLPDWERKRVLQEHPELLPHTEDLEALEAQLLQIRREQFAQNFHQVGGRISCGYAVPIFQGERCVAALGLAFYDKEDPQYPVLLKAAAAEIHRRIRFEE